MIVCSAGRREADWCHQFIAISQKELSEEMARPTENKRKSHEQNFFLFYLSKKQWFPKMKSTTNDQKKTEINDNERLD